MKKRNRNRLVVVLLSDLHAGHKLGLLNPDTPLMDEHATPYCPSLNTTQRYLYNLYLAHIEQVADLADGCPVILDVNGDITHGAHYAEHLSLVSVADQITAAAWDLCPWYTHPRIRLTHVRIIVGTAAHSWEGSAEPLVANQLSQMYPKIDTRPLYHLQQKFTSQNDQVIDLAHHGPFPGSRKWLEGSIARRYLISAMMDEIVDGVAPPILYARAHYHQYVHVGPERIRQNGHDIESSLVITPSYSGIDDYVRQATRSKGKIDHGLVALEFNGGLGEVYPFYQELDIRTKEEL
ncbi:MAG: hypothetical protein KKH61_20165 [Gammaproteobacteria bacterium]|nr:hypothetical protein [Gammaproteobacteria bacterium]